VGYELLVCDLDGTLIDHSMALEPALVTAFKRAAAAGLGITIATGRMPLSVDFYREALDIRLPVIYYNGGLIRDAAGMELLRRELPRGILARSGSSSLPRPCTRSSSATSSSTASIGRCPSGSSATTRGCAPT
jgi:hydroxymethylpyrimidine pyrophosphatase-like HAD family hydrolase